MRFLLKSLFVTSIVMFLIGFERAEASDFSAMAYPLEVNMVTDSPYKANDVIKWKINIGGGYPTGPDFDVHFSDSKGNSYWVRDLKSYSTSFNLSYEGVGEVIGYVTVYGAGDVANDSATIMIRN